MKRDREYRTYIIVSQNRTPKTLIYELEMIKIEMERGRGRETAEWRGEG
jgi:hypothetical protein